MWIQLTLFSTISDTHLQLTEINSTLSVIRSRPDEIVFCCLRSFFNFRRLFGVSANWEFPEELGFLFLYCYIGWLFRIKKLQMWSIIQLRADADTESFCTCIGDSIKQSWEFSFTSILWTQELIVGVFRNRHLTKKKVTLNEALGVMKYTVLLLNTTKTFVIWLQLRRNNCNCISWRRKDWVLITFRKII